MNDVSARLRVGLILATQPQGCFNTFAPLGLGYVGASVRNEIPDAEVIYRECLDDLIRERPDIIGIGSASDHYGIAIEHAERIKRELGIPVVIGGIHISLLPESLRECFDAAVIGEGEITFVELLRSFLRNRTLDPVDLQAIAGLAFWLDGKLIRTRERAPIANLDALPQPVIEELPYYNPADAMCLVSARGCPYNCSFCSSARFARKYRSLSMDLFAAQIDYWVTRKGVRNIVIYDDLLIADRKKLADLTTRLEARGILGRCAFDCQVRANLVTDEVCRLLVRLNVTQVGMGLESFSDKVLEYYNKSGCTAEINQRALDLLHKYGIAVGPGIILGAPVETREDLLLTLRAVYRNLRDGKIQKPGWGELRPFPGTKIWDFAQSQGLVSPDMDWKGFAQGCYLCQAIPRAEFLELIEEWVTKCSILLLDRPGVGGNFVCADIEKVWADAQALVPKIRGRDATELGDGLVLDFVANDAAPAFLAGCHEKQPDGSHWLGKRATVLARYRAAKELSIHGHVPAAFLNGPFGGSLKVTVERPNGAVVASRMVDAAGCPGGEFTFSFLLPPADSASIIISTDKSVIPRDVGINADERELSFLLRDIRINGIEQSTALPTSLTTEPARVEAVVRGRPSEQPLLR